MSCSTCKHEELQASEYPCCECDWEYMNQYGQKRVRVKQMNNQEAIKSMRNLDDLISITESEHESVRLAISALEKQIPKEPNKSISECKYVIGVCPTCSAIHFVKQNFCYHCGQAIDWSVEE